MRKGDIVLVPFPFTDLTGKKKRPATISIASEDDVTICFITTQHLWWSQFDVLVNPSNVNGLKKTSLMRLIRFATIYISVVIGLLEQLEEDIIIELNQKLVSIFKLDT